MWPSGSPTDFCPSFRAEDPSVPQDRVRQRGSPSLQRQGGDPRGATGPDPVHLLVQVPPPSAAQGSGFVETTSARCAVPRAVAGHVCGVGVAVVRRALGRDGHGGGSLEERTVGASLVHRGPPFLGCGPCRKSPTRTGGMRRTLPHRFVTGIVKAQHNGSRQGRTNHEQR